MAETRAKAKASRGRKALLLLFGTCLGLLAGEVVARLAAPFTLIDGGLFLSFGARTPEADVEFETVGDQTLWFRPHPGRAAPAPADVAREGVRIVVLSDSVLEAAGVSDAEGAVARVAARFAARDDLPPVEMVNLAEGGWNVRMHEVLLNERVWALSPDIVLVGVTGNDTQQYAWRDGRLWDVFLVDALEGERAAAGPLARHSYLYNWVWLSFFSESVASATYQDDPDTVARMVVDPLERMADAAAERGVTFAVLCNPELDQDIFRPELGGCAFRSLRSRLTARGVAFLDPWPRYAPLGYDAIALDGIHLNPRGHVVLAEALEEWLAPLVAERAP